MDADPMRKQAGEPNRGGGGMTGGRTDGAVMSEISRVPVEQIAIGKIVVGVRRRQKLGKLQALKSSIAQVGLVHPILVRNGNELVCGQRRLEACRQLGWERIPARRVETMSDEELRTVELDENVVRLDFVDFETSKARLAQIRQAEADLKAKEAEEAARAKAQAQQSIRSEQEQKLSKRGRKGEGRPRGKMPGSKRAIAEQTGISLAEQVRIEHHVSLAEKYPFMQRNGWVQHQVLEAGTLLEQIPEDEHQSVAALLDQPAIPPKKSIEMLANLAQVPAKERKAIYDLAASPSQHERSTALAKACKTPPPPDPSLSWVRDATHALKRAVKECREARFVEPIKAVLSQTVEIERTFTDFVRSKSNGNRAD
jgi:ParB family chromosome partitioning protein